MKSDTQLFVARLNPKAAIEYVFANEGFGWLQVARGRVMANELSLEQGDALAISLEKQLTVVATEEAGNSALRFAVSLFCFGCNEVASPMVAFPQEKPHLN